MNKDATVVSILSFQISLLGSYPKSNRKDLEVPSNHRTGIIQASVNVHLSFQRVCEQPVTKDLVQISQGILVVVRCYCKPHTMLVCVYFFITPQLLKSANSANIYLSLKIKTPTSTVPQVSYTNMIQPFKEQVIAPKVACSQSEYFGISYQ